MGEVKKSSKAAKSAEMQLAYYLYRLKQNGVKARGQLLFPKERKRKNVVLTQALERELKKLLLEINELILAEKPPPFRKIGYCANCGYKEFCWS